MDLEMEIPDIGPNVRCGVCGNSEFDLRAGFYFCQECGTKHDRLQEVEVDHDVQYREANITKVKKLKKEKIEKPNLTSWECYNYILRGLVDELLQIGAKEEITLITLQIWTAYLRRKEIAFFSKKEAELPRLGARFHKRDARILYNHIGKKPRKRKRKPSDRASSTGGESSRDWSKAKRKLDESIYSATTDNSESKTSAMSSSTGTTHHAIRLKLSAHARKAYKKLIPVKHIKKHEEDTEGELKCHSFPPKYKDLKEKDISMAKTTIRELYGILALALNLAEDQIQLSDLVRFIAEGHIGTKNVLQYFPENVIMHGKEILREIGFYRYEEKLTYRALRENMAFTAKLINMKSYMMPDLISLVQRYTEELNLPPEIATYAERLINLFPPEMKMRPSKIYPAYEARAMAYIVFVLKLLFGLEGHKEQEISKAAKKLNEEIHDASERSSSRHAKLFVWSEWVEYIEMRKIILSQYSSVYSQLFNVEQTMSQQLEELAEMLNAKAQREVVVSDADREVPVAVQEQATNLHTIMQRFLESTSEQSECDEEPDSIKFQPSYTPCDSYFKRIRLHATINSGRSNIKIPEFMRVDHTLRTLTPYLNAKSLREFFKEIGIKLKVKSIACTDKRCYVGMFVGNWPYCPKPFKADTKISEEEWLNNIEPDLDPEEVGFKKVLDCYEKQYMKKLEKEAQKRQPLHIDEKILSYKLPVINPNNDRTKREITGNERDDFDVMSMHSYEVFSENNMEPLESLSLQGPRRDLENINLLQNSENDDSDEEETNECNIDESNNSDPTLTLVKSNMDCWILMGSLSELIDLKKKSLESKFPRSFFWLLETCAQIIHVDWGVLYDQLLAIEIIFGYSIESLDDFKDCIYFKKFNKIKDLNILINWYRENW